MNYKWTFNSTLHSDAYRNKLKYQPVPNLGELVLTNLSIYKHKLNLLSKVLNFNLLT